MISSKPVFVTGAAGFIGSHVVEELLRRGYGVRAFVHYNSRNDWGNLDLVPKELTGGLEVRSGDMCDFFCVRQAMRGCGGVMHLAALIAIPYSYVAPRVFIDVNAGGAMNLAQAALDEGIARFVHVSTSETYGTARYVPIDEGHPLTAQSPYSASKIAADKVIESFHLTYGLPAVTVRPFNTFGPRQSARAIIPTIFSQALSGNVVKLGSLTPTRDFTFVSDTAAGMIAALEADGCVGETINLGNGKEISMGELARKILAITGSAAEIEADQARVRPEASEVGRLCASIEKAQRLLNWSPKTSLDEGLRKTADWIRSNLARYKTGIYNI